MVLNLKKTDVQQNLATPVELPGDIKKTDVIFPSPDVVDPGPQPAPTPADPPQRTVVDDLQKALAISLARELFNTFEPGAPGPFSESIGELVDAYRGLSQKESQGALTEDEFRRQVDRAAAQAFGGARNSKTEQQLDSAIMRAVGEISAVSTPDIALLPDPFLTPLLEQTKGQLFNFGLQGGGSNVSPSLLSSGPGSGQGGLQQFATRPLYFAVGSNLVSCINETSPTAFDDEFRIFVSGTAGGSVIPPIIYNKDDAIRKFESDGDNDFSGDQPRRFEYTIQQMPVGTVGYLLVGFPYEEDELTDAEVKKIVDATRKALEAAGPVLDKLIDEAINKVLTGANPGLAIAVALLRKFLETLEIRERITSLFFTILSNFLSDLPGVKNDAFTPFTLSGTFARDVSEEIVEATMTASVQASDSGPVSFPKTVKLSRKNKDEKESIKTISNLEVREVPLGARGRYQLTTVIAIRPTILPPS